MDAKIRAADFAGSELAEDAKNRKNRREKHLNLPKTTFFSPKTVFSKKAQSGWTAWTEGFSLFKMDRIGECCIRM